MDGRWSTLIEGLVRYNWRKINQFRVLLPSRCVLCAGPAAAGSLCPGCRTDLPWRVTSRLSGAFEIHASFRYEFPLVQCIGRAKLGGDFGLAREIGRWMAQCPPVPPGRIDALCPVPQHWQRAMTRGYNQALEIARPIAAALGAPLFAAGLRRRAGEPQRGLARRERLVNVAGQMSADPRLAGLRVLLIDDVTTTGATLREAQRALRATGAREVIGWAAAAVD